MRHVFVALVLGLTPAATAEAVQPVVSTVDLSNFKFSPATIELRAGAPAILRLRNSGSAGHSFSAPAFFAEAQLDPRSAALVHDGRVEVPGHSNVDVLLVPAAGQYALKCSHVLHSAFGMKGRISVR